MNICIYIGFEQILFFFFPDELFSTSSDSLSRSWLQLVVVNGTRNRWRSNLSRRLLFFSVLIYESVPPLLPPLVRCGVAGVAMPFFLFRSVVSPSNLGRQSLRFFFLDAEDGFLFFALIWLCSLIQRGQLVAVVVVYRESEIIQI